MGCATGSDRERYESPPASAGGSSPASIRIRLVQTSPLLLLFFQENPRIQEGDKHLVLRGHGPLPEAAMWHLHLHRLAAFGIQFNAHLRPRGLYAGHAGLHAGPAVLFMANVQLKRPC